MTEMRHDIEFAASFGNFVPGIFSVLYGDIYRQQLQVEARRGFSTVPALRDGTDVTGRTRWEGGATDFRMKFDSVRHLSHRVDNLKEIRHMKS